MRENQKPFPPIPEYIKPYISKKLEKKVKKKLEKRKKLGLPTPFPLLPPYNLDENRYEAFHRLAKEYIKSPRYRE
jgi:hypothetical protein